MAEGSTTTTRTASGTAAGTGTGTVLTGTGTGTVLVRYFAAAAEAAGVEEEHLETTATLGALRDLLVARYGAPMARVVANGSFLVDGVVRRDPATPVGAQVDVLPPFAGG